MLDEALLIQAEEDELSAVLGLSGSLHGDNTTVGQGSSSPKGGRRSREYQQSLLMLAAEDTSHSCSMFSRSPVLSKKAIAERKFSASSSNGVSTDSPTLSSTTTSDNLGSSTSSWDGGITLADEEDEYEDSLNPADGESQQNEGSELQDGIMQALLRPPSQRTDEDLSLVMDFVQNFSAFVNLTLTTRKKLCTVLELETILGAGTVIVHGGDEPAYWWVVLEGTVEELCGDDLEPQIHVRGLGECFGAARGQIKAIQQYSVATRENDTSLLRIASDTFHDILSQSELDVSKTMENGKVVLITEPRNLGTLYAQVVVCGTEKRLIDQLIDEDDVDPTYVEDFLLGYRTFINAIDVTKQLSDCFDRSADTLSRTVQVMSRWLHIYPNDFEKDIDMIRCVNDLHRRLKDAGMECEADVLCNATQNSEVFNFQKTKTSCHASKRLLRVTKSVPEGATQLDFLDVVANKLENQSQQLKKGPQSPTSCRSPFNKRRRFVNKISLDSKLNAQNLKVPLGAQLFSSCESINFDSNSMTGYNNVQRVLSNSSFRQSAYLKSPVEELLQSAVTIKLYRQDHSFKYIAITAKTTAVLLVQIGLRQFDISSKSMKDYSLCRVTVTPEGVVKQTRLPNDMTGLQSHLGITSRYYLKKDDMTANLVHGDLVQEILQEGSMNLLSFDVADVARTITLRDFDLFQSITPVEYLEDLWSVKKRKGGNHLEQFSCTTNKEMFWVITELLSEPVLTQRVRLVKFFIKVAKHCRRIRNFNTMFAITSGLTYGAVSRLKTTWEKVSGHYIKEIEEMQKLMDPSRNMYNYRRLVNGVKPPIIPFFPVVKKDLTFMYLGNDNKVEGLINFEKIRMVINEVRHVCVYHSVPYEPASMMSDLKERLDNRRAHELWFSTKRIRQYFDNFSPITDEAMLKEKANKLELAQQELLA